MQLVPRLRHETARHPWLYRAMVAALALTALWSAVSFADRLEVERASWGATRAVVVTADAIDNGSALHGSVVTRHHPTAVVPESAVAPEDIAPDTLARRDLPVGVVLTSSDLRHPDRQHELLEPHQVAVTVAERIRSGARLGDTVVVVSEGLVLTERATVLSVDDDRVVLAADARHAPMIAAAASGPGGVSLLIAP